MGFDHENEFMSDGDGYISIWTEGYQVFDSYTYEFKQ